LNKLDFPFPRIICTKFDINFGLLVECRRKFLKMFSVFSLFCYYIPFERGNPFHLKQLESPSPKDDLCLVKIGPARLWRRRLLNDPPFLHFCDYLPFEKDLALYLNKLEFLSPKDNLY
jgi:hypothetical protein